MRLRFTYSAKGSLRWASHLELAGELVRWARRAGLDAAYSEGFNQRPKMTLCPPKPVGMTACADAAEITLTSAALREDGISDLTFAGIEDVTLDAKELIARYPGQIHADNSAAPYEETRIAEFEAHRPPPDWFSCIVAALPEAMDLSNLTQSGDTPAAKIAERLIARAHPDIRLLNLRFLADGEPKLSKAICASAMRALIIFADESSVERAVECLEGGAWIVAGAPGKPAADAKPLALDAGWNAAGNTLAIYIKGLSEEGKSFPAMRFLSHITGEWSGIPLAAERVAFLDGEGGVVT